MKKKALLFFVYSVIIILTLVLILVFTRQNRKENLPKTPNQTEDSASNDQTTEEDNESNENNNDNEENIIYATSLKLSLPATINLLIGTTATFESNYISVEPSSMLDKVKQTVIPKNGAEVGGLKFSNNKLTAIKEGSYDITFSVAKTETENLTKSVTVVVYNNYSLAHLRQIKNSFYVGEALTLTEIFEIYTANPFSVSTDSKTAYSNNILTAVTLGTSNVTFSFADNYIRYIYNFKISIKEQPFYEIVLNNVVDNKIELNLNGISAKQINYEIKNRNEENVNQVLLIEIEDESVVKVETNTAPIVKLRGIKTGQTTVTLICASDTSVRLSIIVIVK